MGKKLWIFIFEVHNFEKNVCNLNVWRYTLAICQQIFCSHRNYSAKPRYGVSSAHCVCSCLCYYLMHKAMINQRHAGIAIFVDSYHGWGWWKWRGETATVDFMWQGEIVRHYLVLFMFCQAFLDVSVHLCLHVCFYLRLVFSDCGGHSMFPLPEHGVQGNWLESFFNQTNAQQEDWWHTWYRMPMLVSGTTLFIRFLGPRRATLDCGTSGFSPCKVHSCCIGWWFHGLASWFPLTPNTLPNRLMFISRGLRGWSSEVFNGTIFLIFLAFKDSRNPSDKSPDWLT